MPKFAQGCDCKGREALLDHFLRSVGTVIAQNNPLDASNMLNTFLEKEGHPFSIEHLRSIVNALWIGAAIPKGNWHELLQKLRHPMTEFFLLQEKQIERAGYSLEEIVDYLDLPELRDIHTVKKRTPIDVLQTFWRKLSVQ